MMAADGGGDRSRVGPDFDLPDEILSVMPTDPYDQLDLARKITSIAIASRVTNLETEADSLQQQLIDKDPEISVLEDRVYHLETAYQGIELRLKIKRGENMKLLKERDSLAFTAEKLNHHLTKLQNFKRELMQSLNDDSFPETENTYDQSVPKAYPTSDDDSNGYTKYHSFGTSNDNASINDSVVQQDRNFFSTTPNETPRFTPTGTPNVFSSNASPKRYSAASSPQRTSGTTSPTTQGSSSLSSWYPSSQMSSGGTNSPTSGHPLPARPPRINGKVLFRQARSRLSLEQFSAFLANVKELHAQKQSREETLRKAEEIFGMDNKDLYALFQGLLGHSMQ